jgi:hypothetical protein
VKRFNVSVAISLFSAVAKEFHVIGNERIMILPFHAPASSYGCLLRPDGLWRLFNSSRISGLTIE